MNDKCGIIVNSSRSIIYSSSGKDFDKAASISAKKLKIKWRIFLKEKKNYLTLIKSFNYLAVSK